MVYYFLVGVKNMKIFNKLFKKVSSIQLICGRGRNANFRGRDSNICQNFGVCRSGVGYYTLMCRTRLEVKTY